MKTPLSKQQALDRLMDQCSRSEVCIAEVKTKLYRWQVDLACYDEIIAYLIANRYIDELRYAMAFVRDKNNFSHWGALKIKYALKLKAIPKAYIDLALEQLDDQHEMMEQCLTKKIKTIKYTNKYQLYTKLMRFGISRGFNYTLLSKTCTHLCQIELED